MTKKTIEKKSKTVPKKKITKKAAKKPKRLLQKPVQKIKAIKAKNAIKTKLLPKPIGEITHFYDHIGVGVVALKGELKIGDQITISGHGRTFEQKVGSMQVEHKPISVAKKGQIIGMKVAQPAKEKDLVYKK